MNFSDDDVVNYMVVEALTFRKHHEDQVAREKQEQKEFMEGKKGLSFEELEQLAGE